MRNKVGLEELNKEPYISVLCYPKPSDFEFKKRLKELRKIGITRLEFSGRKQVSKLRVLGKGCVGIVVMAFRDRQRFALKIRRVDADRATMQYEARLLRKANSVFVGPSLVATSRNFILMQFVDGKLFPVWLENERSKTLLKRVLREVLEQCWRLDETRLDHGELSNASKHLIITRNNKPFVVDFETASVNRRTANVTSTCQFLFIGGKLAKDVERRLATDRKSIVEALRLYKKDKSRRNFERVLESCRL